MVEDTAVAALLRSTQEPEDFARFYDEHAQSLFVFFVRRVHESEVAFDLTAETFAQAYEGRGRFRGQTDAEAAGWLFRIARRQLARYYKRGWAEQRALTRLGVSVPQMTEDQEERIEELADLAGLRSTVREELERLSNRVREAVRLRVIEELPYPDVAALLGVSEQAARARVSRGLRALEEALSGAPETREAI